MMIFCPLYSGSSGNSILVGSEETKILIDSGVSGKNIEIALKSIDEKAQNIKGIFVTHEHIDHIKSVGILSRKYNIPVFANEETWQAMKSQVGKMKENNIRILDERYLELGDLTIQSYSISHDAVNPVGYNIYHKNKKATVATDLGYISQEVKQATKESDVILMESNHDVEMLKFGTYPYSLKRRVLGEKGHLSNDACGEAIVELLANSKPKKIFLGHLSKNNNYPELAYKTVENILRDNSIQIGKDIDISMTYRDRPSEVIKF